MRFTELITHTHKRVAQLGLDSTPSPLIIRTACQFCATLHLRQLGPNQGMLHSAEGVRLL